MLLQRFDQGVHRRKVAGLHQCPVKHDGRRRRVFLPIFLHILQGRQGNAGPVETRPDQWRWLQPIDVAVQKRCAEPQQVLRIAPAPMGAVLPDAVTGVRGEGGIRLQLRVRVIVAGNDGEFDVVFTEERADPFQPIGPIAGPAQQPHDDQLCRCERVFHIHIDRHVVAELHQIGEPEAGQCPRHLPIGFRQQRQIAGGGGKENNIPRRLAEIDGFAAVVDLAGLGDEKVHQTGGFNAASAAARSKSCRPMTTSRLCRVSPSAQGRSK